MAGVQAVAKVEMMTGISVEYFSDATIEGFIASRKCSPNTAKTYRNAICQLLKFFAVAKVTAPTTGDCDRFLSGLRANRKSDSTIRLYSAALKLYFKYLEKHGIYTDVASEMTPLKMRKSQAHKKASLSNEQAQKLLAAVKGDSLIALRDRAIIALALSTGLRTCEISRANRGDLQNCGDYWTLDVQSKGSLTKDETVKVSPVVAEMILRYLEGRGVVADDEPLFTSTSNNRSKFGVRYSEQSIGKMIARYMRLAGIKTAKTSAHSTRHFSACQAIRNGVDLREVKSMLRHHNINTTLIYLEDIAIERRQAELSVAASLFGVAA